MRFPKVARLWKRSWKVLPADWGGGHASQALPPLSPPPPPHHLALGKCQGSRPPTRCICPLQQVAVRLGLFHSKEIGKVMASTCPAFLQLEKGAPSGGSIPKQQPMHLPARWGSVPITASFVKAGLHRRLSSKESASQPGDESSVPELG